MVEEPNNRETSFGLVVGRGENGLNTCHSSTWTQTNVNQNIFPWEEKRGLSGIHKENNI